MKEHELRKSIKDAMFGTEVFLAHEGVGFGAYKELIWLPAQRDCFEVYWEIDEEQPRQSKMFEELSSAITFYLSREPNE
jgi:hypothetical protein